MLATYPIACRLTHAPWPALYQAVTDCRLMYKRNFQGNIKLHYDVGRMDMKVRVDGEDGKKGTTKDMKSLSGGERSFITVCFMLALAQQISSPFHCMDEFDVFMDAVNRRVGSLLIWTEMCCTIRHHLVACAQLASACRTLHEHCAMYALWSGKGACQMYACLDFSKTVSGGMPLDACIVCSSLVRAR